MAGLFISYRRNDQPGFAGRLADALEEAFGRDNVFRDVEDIHPGDDFVLTIQKQLGRVNVMLVMIGPAWLTASKDGARRLDDPDDFVRREVQVALESGIAVLPVLVDGALMPTLADLPDAIAALARRQAFVLSDAGWTTDIARLVAYVRPLLNARNQGALRPKRMAWVVAIGILIIGLVALIAMESRTVSSRTSSPQNSPEGAALLTGRWTAQVKYDWGDVHDEIFDLRLENGEVHGTASYLQLARTVEEGRLQGNRLSFVTHSQEMMGDSPPREQTHRYRGEVKAGELHLVLESRGGLTTHTPVEFTARRVLK